MDVRELRIGNLVLFENEIREVEGVRKVVVNGQEPMYYVDLAYKYQKKVFVKGTDVYPIPMTKEFLIKVGLDGFPNSEYCDVHRLQNLHFCMKKEELNIIKP